MPEISFALIQSDNLRDKNLKVKQVESVIEVKGKLDPYQLQKIRDHVEDSFKSRQKNINDLIRAKAKEAAKAKTKQDRVKIIEQVDKAIAQSASAFDKKIQASIKEFCEKDIELQQQAKSGNWSYVVNTVWDIGSIVWSGTTLLADGATAVATGGLTIALALKGFLDLCLEVEKLCSTQSEAWNNVRDQVEKILTALNEIKKVKKGSPVPQSLIDRAELAVAPLGSKIDVAEKTVRALSEKLDAMLKEKAAAQAPKNVAAEIQKSVQASVVNIAKIGSEIADARKAQQKAKDSIKAASTKAKADAWSYVSWARERYDSLNDIVSYVLPAGDIVDSMKKVKLYIDKNGDLPFTPMGY